VPDKKLEAIETFINGLAEIRQAVKDDAKELIRHVPDDILLDPIALADFLAEMAVALSRKHLINDNGRIVTAPAKLIRDYVKAMAVKSDD